MNGMKVHGTHRRLVIATALGAVLFIAATATAEDLPIDTAATSAVLSPGAQTAVTKGLDFLVTRQSDDGSFATGGYGRNAAVCALAGMAWLANGSTPDRGPYGKELGRVTDYLLEHALPSGFITVEDAE